MAGQVLLDNPDCPVEVSKAVHALMGVPPPEGPVGSPVSQANVRQAHTEQALQGVSLAAEELLASRTAHGQQLQQSTPNDAAAEAQHMREEATQILSSALERTSNSCQAPSLQAGGRDLQRVGAEMAPMVQQLVAYKHQACHAANINDKSESFQALLAVAMVTQSQQLHGLARYQAANARARLSSAPPVDTEAGLKVPVTSPVRRQAAQEKKAEKTAFQQAQEMQERLQSRPPTAHTAQAAAASTSNASTQRTQHADVLPGNIDDGVVIVYPGHNGEPFWTRWLGM